MNEDKVGWCVWHANRTLSAPPGKKRKSLRGKNESGNHIPRANQESWKTKPPSSPAIPRLTEVISFLPLITQPQYTRYTTLSNTHLIRSSLVQPELIKVPRAPCLGQSLSSNRLSSPTRQPVRPTPHFAPLVFDVTSGPPWCCGLA